MKKIDFNTKNKIVTLAGTCFWYWNTFYSFLESCEIPSSIYMQFGKEAGKFQVMRSLLEFLERQEKYVLIKNIAVELYNFKPTEKEIDHIRANELLEDFRKSVGKNLIEDEVDKEKIRNQIESRKKLAQEYKSKKDSLSNIKNEFLDLQSSQDKQQRGFNLEKIFFRILELEEFEFKAPYKTQGEQIDGHFKFDKFDYLVEIKWTDKQSKQTDLSIFNGKIASKAQSTRGIFLSINGFDGNCIMKNSGNNPRIIFMDGKDLYCILDDRVSFFDLMKLKVDQLVRTGRIYVNFGENSY